MPVRIEIRTAEKVIFSTFSGEIDEGDFQSATAVLADHPMFNPGFSHIIDFSQVTAANVSTDFVKKFAHHAPLFDRNAKQIIVAPQDHIYGMARMVQILRQGSLPFIEVVRTAACIPKILGWDDKQAAQIPEDDGRKAPARCGPEAVEQAAS